MLECWYLPPVKQNPRCFSRKITLHIYRLKERDELLTWTRDAQTHPSLRAERGEKQDERTGTTPSRPSLHATTERFSFLLDNLDTINSLLDTEWYDMIWARARPDLCGDLVRPRVKHESESYCIKCTRCDERVWSHLVVLRFIISCWLVRNEDPVVRASSACNSPGFPHFHTSLATQRTGCCDIKLCMSLCISTSWKNNAWFTYTF